MTIKTKDRKARANYKRKIVSLRVELYPTDQDIKSKLEQLTEPKSTYIKRLIREDIDKDCIKCKHVVSCEPSTIGVCDQYEEEVSDNGR